MHKKVLSEIDLHSGTIDMPKGFEIDLAKLQIIHQVTNIIQVTIQKHLEEITQV